MKRDNSEQPELQNEAKRPAIGEPTPVVLAPVDFHEPVAVISSEPIIATTSSTTTAEVLPIAQSINPIVSPAETEPGTKAVVDISASPVDVDTNKQVAELTTPGLKEENPLESSTDDAAAKPLGVEDALAYLDKVKKQFKDKPDVYNQFLDIMKNFKAEQINTPGVVNCVCELFKGHDDLILGFNTFLPPGFKIEIPGRGMGGVISMIAPQEASKKGRGGGARNRPSTATPKSLGKPLTDPFVPAGPIVEDNASNAGTQGQPVEFDHAINYVTKIKNRFATDADTYKSFLDILHSYQNEQRSIKEVLEQVSHLFKDHSDLLREFTYFLPDAVRESAKTELERRAASLSKGSKSKASRKKDRKSIGDGDHDESRIPQLERNLLGRIKAALGTRELWSEFLKCIDLFAQEVISRAELLALITDIFGERGDLLEEFDRLLASRGATDDPVESAWFSMPLQDIDFSNCKRCTPSYRSLPAAYPKAPCSERTAMCRSVLNDTWVSVPLGSEDSSSKNHRRNPHEDALFKCEDDRYEVDMVIDSTKAAIRALEPLAQEIETLQLNSGISAKFRYRLERRTLNVIHLKAISRIYGDHGTEILELLRRNPAGAIPIILGRLKTKDLEWCKARQEMNNNWRETMDKNYLKSLDHRSFYFKQSEKKTFSSKVLVNELKDSLKSSDKEQFTLTFGSPLIHLDAWSILSFKGTMMGEKDQLDRIAAFYAYFMHSFLQLPQSWLQSSKSLCENMNVGLQVTAEQDPKSNHPVVDIGSVVKTAYGEGIVNSFDDGMYQATLSYGTANILPENIVTDRVIRPRFTSISLPSEMLEHQDETVCEDEAGVFYGTASAYVFLRQYHLLCQRLGTAKELCVTHDSLNKNEGISSYNKLLGLIHSLIAGSLDSQKFEDECRLLVGPSIFFLSTVDRLISALFRQVTTLLGESQGPTDASHAFKQYQTSNDTADLAGFLSQSGSMLLSEGMCIRVKYQPSETKTQEELDQEMKSRSESPVEHSDVVVTPQLAPLSKWKQLPSMKIEVFDCIPDVDMNLENEAELTLGTVCPIEIPIGTRLDLSGAVDFKVTSSDFPQVRDGYLLLSLFRPFTLTVKPQVFDVIREMKENASKTKKPETWYVVLGGRSKSSDSPKDVEMKDDQ